MNGTGSLPHSRYRSSYVINTVDMSARRELEDTEKQKLVEVGFWVERKDPEGYENSLLYEAFCSWTLQLLSAWSSGGEGLTFSSFNLHKQPTGSYQLDAEDRPRIRQCSSGIGFKTELHHQPSGYHWPRRPQEARNTRDATLHFLAGISWHEQPAMQASSKGNVSDEEYIKETDQNTFCRSDSLDFTNKIFCNGGMRIWAVKIWVTFSNRYRKVTLFSHLLSFCEKLEVKGRDRDTSFRLRLRNGTSGVKQHLTVDNNITLGLFVLRINKQAQA